MAQEERTSKTFYDLALGVNSVTSAYPYVTIVTHPSMEGELLAIHSTFEKAHIYGYCFIEDHRIASPEMTSEHTPTKVRHRVRLIFEREQEQRPRDSYDG